MLPQPSGGFVWTQGPEGLALRCKPLARIAAHVFTARGLDLGRDRPGEGEAWRAVARCLGLSPDRIASARQEHGIDALVVRRAPSGPEATGDILVSDDASVAVAVRVADCVPILLADARTGSVAAVHAGWRGTAAGASERAVRVMEQTFDARAADLTAAVGPSIGPCCYCVGPEVIDRFRDGPPATAAPPVDARDGGLYLDLWEATRRQLVASGLGAARVHVAGLCTSTYEAHLYSHRAGGPFTGRMAAAIRAPRSR